LTDAVLLLLVHAYSTANRNNARRREKQPALRQSKDGKWRSFLRSALAAICGQRRVLCKNQSQGQDHSCLFWINSLRSSRREVADSLQGEKNAR